MLPGVLFHFRKEAVAHLNMITEATGAKLVISSSWRIGSRRKNQLPLHFKLEGVRGEVIGMTPSLDGSRGSEIQAWLDENPVEKFVIIDDDSDMDDLIHFLVQVDSGMENGLTETQALEAIRILNEP